MKNMDNAEKKPVMLATVQGKQFYNDEYKNTVFYIWYITGKPRRGKLRQLIEPNADGDLPTDRALTYWINEFQERSTELDKLVDENAKDVVIQEKTAMLEKHVALAIEMQDIAMEYLRLKKSSLNPHSAVRLLVDGIRVERESRGLPSLITEISKSDDEDLMKMIDKILESVDIVQDDEEGIDDQ